MALLSVSVKTGVAQLDCWSFLNLFGFVEVHSFCWNHLKSSYHSFHWLLAEHFLDFIIGKRSHEIPIMFSLYFQDRSGSLFLFPASCEVRSFVRISVSFPWLWSRCLPHPHSKHVGKSDTTDGEWAWESRTRIENFKSRQKGKILFPCCCVSELHDCSWTDAIPRLMPAKKIRQRTIAFFLISQNQTSAPIFRSVVCPSLQTLRKSDHGRVQGGEAEASGPPAGRCQTVPDTFRRAPRTGHGNWPLRLQLVRTLRVRPAAWAAQESRPQLFVRHQVSKRIDSLSY